MPPVGDEAGRRFDRLGLTLLAVQFATAGGLAFCWIGLHTVDHSDRVLAILALTAASLYLAISCLVAGVIYDSLQSRLAIRFYTLAGVGGILAFIAPAVAEALQ